MVIIVCELGGALLTTRGVHIIIIMDNADVVNKLRLRIIGVMHNNTITHDNFEVRIKTALHHTNKHIYTNYLLKWQTRNNNNNTIETIDQLPCRASRIISDSLATC